MTRAIDELSGHPIHLTMPRRHMYTPVARPRTDGVVARYRPVPRQADLARWADDGGREP